jgi:hypothetical protein
MFRIISLFSLLIISSAIYAGDNGFSFAFGTNYGGPLANKTLENASGKSLLGTSFNFAYNLNLSNKIVFIPSLSLDFRHFSYRALERKDTIIDVEIGGTVGSIDTYYQANVRGKTSTVVGSFSALTEFRYSKKSTLLFGFYGSILPKRSDEVLINVIIGEGGFLPDIDSTYNDGANIRDYELGLSLGGKFYISEKVSIDFLTTRALSPFYKIWAPRNEEQEGMKFFSTYVRVSLNYYLFKNSKCPCRRRY